MYYFKFISIPKIFLLRVLRKFKHDYEHPDLLFRDHYKVWNQRRFDFVNDCLFDIDKNNYSLLEISAGHANLSRLFLYSDFEITCTDGREEHIKWMNDNFPTIKTIRINLDNIYPELKKYNIVIHFGVLYHLADPLKHLRDFLIKQDFDHLFLETEVANYLDENFVLKLVEDGYDQSMSYIGGRPSANAIEKILKEFDLNWTRHDNINLNSTPHNYNWTEIDTPETYRIGMRRFYHIKKP
jgi:hypothetical protein